MATRSAVRIEGRHAGHVDLYRHWDGYPAEAGAALAEALRDTDSPELVTRRLLQQERGEGDPRPQYEITDSENHGDLEHVYVVARRSGEWLIRHYQRAGNWDNDAWPTWTGGDYTLAGFIDLVNRERKAMNARMAERGATAEQYPMVAA